MIDFDAKETAVFLNPALGETEVAEIRSAVDDADSAGGLVWLTTSGSTGRRKLVGLTREAILCSAAAVNRHLVATDKDSWLLALPGFHVGGLGVVARAHLLGNPVVAPFVDAGWSPLEFLRVAQERGITLSALVPTQLHDLVATGQECPRSIRAIVIGGGALGESDYRAARALGYPVLPSYGLSECASQVATATLASLEQPGMPALTLLDHVAVKSLPDGRLAIRSGALLRWYLVMEPEGPSLISPVVDGWFATEDRGQVNGRVLAFAGRAGSMVKVGGENVDVDRLGAILEEVLRQEGATGKAVLVSVSDERLGHTIAMVTDAGLARIQIDRIAAAFDHRVMPFERIRQRLTVPELPRGPLGKIDKVALLKLIENQSSFQAL